MSGRTTVSRYSKSLWTRRRLLGTGAAALAAPVIAPRRAWAAGNEIRIGFVSPTTGPISGFGAGDDYVFQTLQPVFDQGVDIDGKHYDIKIIRKDSQSNPNRATEVASELILDDEVHLMLSSSTADTVLPVTDQCEVNEVPSLSADTPWDAFFFGRGGNPAKGFDWTYHFFWGGAQVVNSYASLWGQIDTNMKVGLMMSNDSDGVAMSNPDIGFAAQLKNNGLEVIDLGLHEPLSDDYSAQIGKLKDAGVDIITGIFLPPDWTTFWVQAAQLGFRPKAATIAKALLFPSSIEALGDAGLGHSTEIWWSPAHPYPSAIDGSSSQALADGFEAAIGDGTALASVMLVNNETGVVQPLDAVTAAARGAGAHAARSADGRGARARPHCGPAPRASARPAAAGGTRRAPRPAPRRSVAARPGADPRSWRAAPPAARPPPPSQRAGPRRWQSSPPRPRAPPRGRAVWPRLRSAPHRAPHAADPRGPARSRPRDRARQ